MSLKINQALNFIANLFTKKKHLRAKVREFDDVVKTNFLGNGRLKEHMHYTCIACLTIDSVMRIAKKTIRRFIQRNENIGSRKHKQIDS